ncbi:Mucolipin-3 [Trichinella nativa]|uniref:Mucolipin-3 n=1 Tax=Trichinella nativa TaxID=6335 RepID=A0A0V1KWS0_9BILA|nr:Mucolipin-3 [Trichinella nativa]
MDVPRHYHSLARRQRLEESASLISADSDTENCCPSSGNFDETGGDRNSLEEIALQRDAACFCLSIFDVSKKFSIFDESVFNCIFFRVEWSAEVSHSIALNCAPKGCCALLSCEMARSVSSHSFIEMFSNLNDYTSQNRISEEDEMRLRLRFFFMNPLQKWSVRHRLPWKLLLQFVKIIFVTLQLVCFGDMRMGHVNFMEESKTSLRHIFLQGWDAERDVKAYPPNSGPYAIYSMEEFYSQLTHSVVQYYRLNMTTFGNYEYNSSLVGKSAHYPPMNFCLYQYRRSDIYLLNVSYVFDTTVLKNCIVIDLKNDEWLRDDFSIEPLLHSKNMSIQRRKFLAAELSFYLKTVYIRRASVSDLPDCFLLKPIVRFDNAMHTGQVVVSLDVTAQYLNCKGELYAQESGRWKKVFMGLLDIFVMIVCILSLILCIRALLGAHFLRKDTMALFEKLGLRITVNDQLQFLNLWYVLIVVNDICIVFGTALKLILEYRVFDSSLLTATGMLLGIGTLFVWVGVLRYFGLFSQYNILILTLKRSIPNVMRFMLCASFLYCGFLFCGWIVIGPYHLKFRSLAITSSCLFSLINGDDLFATFTTTSDQNQTVFWFVVIYIYVFISLFTYVILSLIISIIMDAYEVVKDRYLFKEEPSNLIRFINQCTDTPNTGRYPRTDSAVFLRCCRNIRKLWTGSVR